MAVNNFDAGYDRITADNSATFVIELDVSVALLSDHYTATHKYLEFTYNDGGTPSELIAETY